MIFVVTIGYDRDEQSVLGAYSTEERALQAARSRSKYWQIDAFALDASEFGRAVVWTDYDRQQKRVVEYRPTGTEGE